LSGASAGRWRADVQGDDATVDEQGGPRDEGRIRTEQKRSGGGDVVGSSHAPRPPGDWIGVRAETHYGSDGVGASVGTLFDERGPVAAIQQAQLVRRR
jgi:Thioesterase-like superfamily